MVDSIKAERPSQQR